jgi:hypothetical protein
MNADALGRAARSGGTDDVSSSPPNSGLRRGAGSVNALLQRREGVAQGRKVVVRAAQTLSEVAELAGLLRSVEAMSDVSDPPLEPQALAFELEGPRVSVGQRMLHRSEERRRGVGSALLEQGANALDERGQVVAHRHV